MTFRDQLRIHAQEQIRVQIQQAIHLLLEIQLREMHRARSRRRLAVAVLDGLHQLLAPVKILIEFVPVHLASRLPEPADKQAAKYTPVDSNH
jgi:hypothetical protein